MCLLVLSLVESTARVEQSASVFNARTRVRVEQFSALFMNSKTSLFMNTLLKSGRIHLSLPRFCIFVIHQKVGQPVLF